jgi:hypothetical protein
MQLRNAIRECHHQIDILNNPVRQGILREPNDSREIALLEQELTRLRDALAGLGKSEGSVGFGRPILKHSISRPNIVWRHSTACPVQRSRRKTPEALATICQRKTTAMVAAATGAARMIATAPAIALRAHPSAKHRSLGWRFCRLFANDNKAPEHHLSGVAKPL